MSGHQTMHVTENIPCGWFGSVETFLEIGVEPWLDALCAHQLRCMGTASELAAAQEVAWRNCHSVLANSFQRVKERVPSARNWTLIFEYELPRERGRRPDLVVLTESNVLVLEFKDFSQPLLSHFDQALAYARDLRHYHSGCRGRNVHAVLLATKSKASKELRDGVHLTSPGDLAVLLCSLGTPNSETPNTEHTIDPHDWVNSDYAPLPSLITAARLIFRHEPLPQIHKAHSAGIPETLRTLHAISEDAKRRGELHLALVTGVPGAGKTLVGLQFVYGNHFATQSSEKAAVFLSGNGPLVKVLQHVLRSSVFVQDVHGFLKQYGGDKVQRPMEHIWVYDEAQRAWDSERAQQMRGHLTSEPEDFLRIGERMESWAMMVGLIGQGQEIHIGEEAGLKQWNDALTSMSGKWVVHCPTALAGMFTAAARVEPDNTLSLTTSLRSHIAEDVQTWIVQLLEGNLRTASGTAARMTAQGFQLYLTNDLKYAADYVRQRYESQTEKRYGLLASSKAKNLPKYGVQNGFTFTRRLREGPWFNDSPDSRFSCCALHDVATEFQCQGLELDFPIVCWGDDLLWSGAAWTSHPSPRSAAKNPHQLRLNSYRVLLSRGRDGLVVFVPPEAEMASTYSALGSAGFKNLR
jgi:hypothetical protein